MHLTLLTDKTLIKDWCEFTVALLIFEAARYKILTTEQQYAKEANKVFYTDSFWRPKEKVEIQISKK